MASFSASTASNSSVGLLRAHFQAGFAPNAFLTVDSSNVAVFGVDEGGSDRAVDDARGCGTLPAGGHFDVIGNSVIRGNTILVITFQPNIGIVQ